MRRQKKTISTLKKYKYQKKPKFGFNKAKENFDSDLVVKGTLQGNQKGFAFLIPEDKTQKDIFLAPKNLKDAIHGDKVLVRILSKEGEQSDEGEVIEVLQRNTQNIVGVYKSSKNFGFVVPDDKRYYKDIFVAIKDSFSAKDNQKVVAKITLYPRGNQNPQGEVIEILGYEDEKDVELLSVIRTHNLYEEFEEDVLAAAKLVPQTIDEAEIARRADLRNITTITIDGFDARDLDDAISIEEHDGYFRLGVHIADVTHYVKENSLIDKEALNRGTSVYFPDRVYPMLPKELSNGICSLNPKVDRLTLSVFINIDKTGDILSYKIQKGVIKTTERMTYDSVTKILEEDKDEIEKNKHIYKDILSFKKLAEILIKKRKTRGSIDLDLPEFKVIMTENGDEIKDIIPYPRKLSHRIIEEFMVLTNEVVAEHITKLKLPFIYRVHEKPSLEKVEDFKKFLTGFNLTLTGDSENIKPKDYAKLIGKIEGEPFFYVVNRVMLRTMMKAKYSEMNLGHFGLSSKCYSHFTSPIRRYPDLAIHRIIKAELDGILNDKKIDKLKRKVSEHALQSSERERIAELAERDVDDYLKTKYMRKSIGKEFDGIISGIKEFGFFVELANTIEGRVDILNLPKDDYNYSEQQISLTGKKYKFKIGDKVRIKVAGADTATRKIDFELII